MSYFVVQIRLKKKLTVKYIGRLGGDIQGCLRGFS